MKVDPNNTIARNGLSASMDERKLKREFDKFLGEKKGIKLDIVSIHDLSPQSIILLKPYRNLSSKEQALEPYIKAKLLCEMPRAIYSP